MPKTDEIDVLDGVLRLIEETLKIAADKVDIDANFETFGINSLIVMDLMEKIEKEFEVTLTPAQFSNVDTVRGLAHLLEGLLHEQEGSSNADIGHQPTHAPTASAIASSTVSVGTNASSRSTDDDLTPEREFVARQFGVDLSGRTFHSVDELVDALVSDHATELMKHYGLYSSGSTDYPTRRAEVAIVGVSCRFPEADSPRDFWDNLVNLRNSVREIPESRWDPNTHYARDITPGKTVSKWGALIDDVECFDAGFFGMPAEEAAHLDPQQRLLLQETYHAVEDAGIDMAQLAGAPVGVFVGYEYSEYEHHLRRLNNQDFTKGPLFSSSSPTYYLANQVSYVFDLCGPSECYNVNCASSAIALNRAYHSLIDGESDLALAGGVSLNLFEGDYIAASQYGILSPTGTTRVFDDEADGFTRGEAVAAVALKRLEDAEREQNPVYGVIRGCHQDYRGAARNISEVKYEAIARVIQDTHEKAGIESSSVHYVEVDGYATKWADSFEYEGIKAAFDGDSHNGKDVALGSVKGNIGNVESVSAVANVIKVALSLSRGRFPPTVSMEKPNAFMDLENGSHPLYIANRELPLDELRRGDELIRAGINSFADSGSQVHIVLEEYPATHRQVVEPGKQLFLLSAANPERLQRYVDDFIEFLEADGETDFADIVYTSQVGRQAMSERLAILAGSRDELTRKLGQVQKSDITQGLRLEAKGIFHGRAEPSNRRSMANLVTSEMANTQLGESLRTSEWKPVAQLWVNGVLLPWERVWRGQPVRRVSLPTYPFAREPYWVDVDVRRADEAEPVASIRSPELARGEAETPPQSSGAGEASRGADARQAERPWYIYRPSEQAEVPADAAAIEPGEKLELFLRQEAANQLDCGLGELSLDKDFLELGLSSVGVAELITKIDSLLASNLSPSVVFNYPEIESLAGYLAEKYPETTNALIVTQTEPAAEDIKEAAPTPEVEGRADAQPTPGDILVPVQGRGSRTPIFSVPGAGGSAMSMQQLAQNLGREQPFFCLEPVGLTGTGEPMRTIEEIAAFNLRAVRAQQGHGPYRLLGYSNGGVVAFEMARQLLAEGEDIRALILLDSLAPGVAPQDRTQDMVEVFNHFVRSLGGHSELTAETLAGVAPEERSTFLYDHLLALGIEQVPRQQFMATFETAMASDEAVKAYQPQPVSGPLDATLIRSTEGFPEAPDDYGWNPLLPVDARIKRVSGDHFTFLEGESGQGVATAVKSALRNPRKKLSRKADREPEPASTAG